MSKKKIVQTPPQTSREKRIAETQSFHTNRTIGVELRENSGGIYVRKSTPTDLPTNIKEDTRSIAQKRDDYISALQSTNKKYTQKKVVELGKPTEFIQE